MASQIDTTFNTLSRDQLLGVSRVGALETTDKEFASVFKTNPAAALAAKGIVISDAQATKLASEVKNLSGGQSAAAEITVSISVSF